MKRFVVLATVLLLAASACGQGLVCEGGCKANLAVKTFSIPLGTIYSALRAIACALNPLTCPGLIAEIAAGMVIPSIEITLRTTATVQDFFVSCPDGCCPEGVLHARPNVVVYGTTTVQGLLPVQAAVAGSIPGPEIADQSEEDENPVSCRITRRKIEKIPVSGFRVSLVFLDNLRFKVYEERVAIDVSAVSVDGVGCIPSYDCRPTGNRPPNLAVGLEYQVPVGRVTPLPIGASDPDGDAVHIWVERMEWDGAKIYYDPRQGTYVADIAADYAGRERVGFPVFAYDLRPGVTVEGGQRPKPGQYFHEVVRSATLVITRNQPPVAKEATVIVRHMDLLEAPLRPIVLPFRAEDPDLPGDNWGYDHVFIWNTLFLHPSGWECACARWEPAPLYTKADCCSGPLGDHLAYDLPCWVTSFEHVIVRGAIRGETWQGVFTVLEVSREKVERGYASSASVHVIVNNKPPVTRVSPREITAKPGALLQATVTATDPDGDAITLTQTSGPGTFAPVEGMGTVSGIWSWTVPEKLRSFSTWVGFVAKDPFDGVGYGFLHVRTLTPPQVHDATALVRRGGRGTAWAYVHDPDSPWVSVHVSSHPGISVIAEVLDDPFAPGMGGFMVAFDVSVDSALCDGDYSIPFTVTDPDGLSAEGALTVHVFGN